MKTEQSVSYKNFAGKGDPVGKPSITGREGKDEKCGACTQAPTEAGKVNPGK